MAHHKALTVGGLYESSMFSAKALLLPRHVLLAATDGDVSSSGSPIASIAEGDAEVNTLAH